MNPPAAPSPRYRSVAVHWPRLISGCVVMTGILILSATWEPMAPVWDSPVLGLLAIGVLFALVIGFGRPFADYEVSDYGILRREGVFFSLLRRGHAMPWAAVESAVVEEEMDGSRSLTLRTSHGAEWKVWEKFGTKEGFDAFHLAVTQRLESRPRSADAAPPVQVRSVWDGTAARVVVGALVVGWIALAVLTATSPAELRGLRIAKLAALALLLAPMLWRAFVVRGRNARG